MLGIWDKLSPGAQELARIPRLAILIALMPEPRLARLNSKAAAYWEAYTAIGSKGKESGLLDQGLDCLGAEQLGWHLPNFSGRNELVRKWQVRLACNILAALAFQMLCGKDGDGRQKPLDRVERNVDIFLNEVARKLSRAEYYTSAEIGPYANGSGNPIDSQYLSLFDFHRLSKMNSVGLQFLLFSNLDQHSIDFTNNISARNFFAAFWAVRWANDDDRNLMMKWFPDPLQGEGDKKEYREFWEMVIELREIEETEKQSFAFDADRWELLFRPIYNRDLKDENGYSIRSNEFVCRTWERMKVQTRMDFCNEFNKMVNNKNDQSHKTAVNLLFSFDKEKRFQSRFIRLADPEDTLSYGTLNYGDSDEYPDDGRFPENTSFEGTVGPFLLHSYCVSNIEFELFDPRRRDVRSFSEQIGDVDVLDDHPVVMVNFYDAKAYTLWLSGYFSKLGYHIKLPSEKSWEYACRCGSSSEFTWEQGASKDDNKAESGWCNFNGRFPYPGEQQVSGIYLGRSISVTGDDETLPNISANPWGLTQLAGNVYELCADSFDEDSNSKVIRGGCWKFYGRYCRSSSRNGISKSSRQPWVGFRLCLEKEADA